MRHTVRAFVVFLATVSAAAAFIVVALLFYRPVADRIRAEQAAELDRLLLLMTGSAEPASLQRDFAAWDRSLAASGYRLSLIGPDGDMLADSLPPRSGGGPGAEADRGAGPEVLAAFHQGQGVSLRYSAGQNYLYAARRLDVAGDGPVMVLRLGAPYSLTGGLAGDIFKKFALAAAVATVFAFAFSLVSTMELKGDLRRVNALARDLAEGRPARPIPRRPNNDLGDLGLALNRLAERLAGESADTGASKEKGDTV